MSSATAVASAGFYSWVDDDGVIHYSQWAPEDVDDVTTLFLTDRNPPDYDPADDPYSIGKQAERTNETWKALAAKRDERREKRREDEERAAENRRRYDRSPYPYYPPRVIHRPIVSPVHTPFHAPIRPPVEPPKPAWPVKPPGEWTDPFRSAHIGVRPRAR